MTFDVKIGVKELFGFSMYKFYSGLIGKAWIVFSIICLGYAVYSFGEVDISGTIALVFMGMLFTVIQPVWLYTKVLARVKKTPQYEKPFTYTFTKKGFHISQGEAHDQLAWTDVFQIICRKNVLYICPNPSVAQIISLSQLAPEKREELKEYLRTQVKDVRKKGL